MIIKLCLAAVMVWLLVRYYVRLTKYRKYLLAVTCIGILSITLFLRQPNYNLETHIMPLWTIIYWTKRLYLAYGISHAFDIIIGVMLNVLLFIPFGLLLPSARLTNGKKIVVIGFVFSLVIEIIQAITRLGMFETDDLVANSVGTWIGYSIWKGISSRAL